MGTSMLVGRKRDVNIDLFRIISMLLIIFLHSIDHSGVLEATVHSSFLMAGWVYFAYALTQVCVNCYVLISGYYLVSSKFKLEKLVKLWLEVVFYSFIIKVLFMAFGDTPFSLLSLISCFVPILTGRYWFVTIYFGLYLISPALNILIKHMTKYQHTALNVLLFCLFSVWVSIHPSIAGMNTGGGWGLAWFVVLYLVAAWFRQYYQPNLKHVACMLIWILVSIGMMALPLMVGETVPLIGTVADHWYRYDSLPVYVATISLFITFLNIRIKNNALGRLITILAPATFGVYLIHAHADMSPWIWEKLDLPQYMDMCAFPIIQIGIVILIFVVCVVIDLIRKYTIGRIENTHIVKQISSYIESLGRKWMLLLMTRRTDD